MLGYEEEDEQDSYEPDFAEPNETTADEEKNVEVEYEEKAPNEAEDNNELRQVLAETSLMLT
jgi:hypothetical protein